MPRHLSHVYHNLSTLLDAGVPLLRTLETAGSAIGKMGGVLEEVRSSVRQGKDLAEAMAEHPKVFDGFDVAVVRVGETAGSLPDSFKRLGEWYDFKKRMRGIIISGSVYPLLLLHFGALIAPVPRLVLGGIGHRLRRQRGSRLQGAGGESRLATRHVERSPGRGRTRTRNRR